MIESLLKRKSSCTRREGIRSTRLTRLILTVVSLTFIVACTRNASDTEIWYIWRNLSNAEIRVLNPINSQVRVIARSATGGNIVRAALSPDGRHVAYIGDDPVQRASIWLANADGSNPTRVTPGSETAWFSWLDNDSLITWHGDWIQGPDFPPLDFQAYDISKQMMVPLTIEGDQTDLFRCGINRSSDHPEIVAQSKSSEPALGHVERQNSVLKMVTDFTVNLSSFPAVRDTGCLSWSSNGDKVVFQGEIILLKLEDLFVVSNQGKSITRLTDFGKDFQEATFSNFALSPDGQRVIAVAKLNPSPVFGPFGAAVLVLVSTDTRKVDFMGLPDVLGPDQLIWSPDSQYVATTAPKVFDLMTDSQIYIIDVAKKETKELSNDSGAKEVFDWR